MAGAQAPPPGTDGSRRVAELIAQRGATDTLLSPWWIVLPIIAVVVAFGLSLVLLFYMAFVEAAVAAVAGGLIAFVLTAVLNYLLIDRMNKHIAREAAVRRAMIEHTWARARARGTSNAVYPYLAALEGIDQQARNEDRPRSLLWALAPIVPIIGVVLYFYMLYFLSKFAFDHNNRWHAFAYNVHLASVVNGDNVPPPQPRYPSESSFVLYLLLTIIFSPFLIFWYFKLIDDPNKHFREMWSFEDGFRAATGRLP